VSLSATGQDTDNGPNPLTYSWVQTSGPQAKITGATTSSPSVTLPPYDCPNRVFTFRVTVSDGLASANATATVTMNMPVFPPAVGNYNADGKAEQAIFNPDNGAWGIPCYGVMYVPTLGSTPVAGEWVTSGRTTPGMYDPNTGIWHYYTGSYTTGSFSFPGQPGDIPVPAKYNNSSLTVAAFYRPSTQQWIINGGPTITFGTATAIPVPGDYDGDGLVDLAYYDPPQGKWYVANGYSVGSPSVTPQGGPGFVPVPGHYTGAPGLQKMVVKKSDGSWWLQGSGKLWTGLPGDIPASADFDGTGTEQIAVYRGSTKQWVWRPYNSPNYSKFRTDPGAGANWIPQNQPNAITRQWP
jgi:hypothetical protein